MIAVPDHLLGREVELPPVTVTREMITAYARAVGDASSYPGPAGEAPPTFCLAMRRGMTPEIPLPPDMFGVYGGHDIEFHQPIRAGETYRITGRVADVYEKIGRSGVLTVIVREATIWDSMQRPVARIIERQIVRLQPPGGKPPPTVEATGGPSAADASDDREDVAAAARPPLTDLDLGHEIGPCRRATPGPQEIARYADAADIAEPIFTDSKRARSLGYRGLVVPGPMLAAFLSQFVCNELPGWQLERLSATFRVPTIAGDTLILRGVVTEHHALADGARLVCDLVIEHVGGERAVTSTATLRRR